MLLEARRPLLLRYLRAANPRELKRLNEGRKAGQHHSAATEVEARIVFEEASKLLTALHKDVVKRPMSG